MRSRELFGAGALVVLALGATFVPLPPATVERYFSQGIYPGIQRVVTGASNLVPFAWMDAGIAIVLAAVGAVFVRGVRAGHGWKPASVRTLTTCVVFTAVGQLIFLSVWGLHYRRLTLEEKLGFDRQLVTQANAHALAAEAVRRLNQTYAGAHAMAVDPARLEEAFRRAERSLGSSGETVIARPKRSLYELYMARAAFSGAMNPIGLEVIVNRELLPVELPEVLAHEWAHLAGYANEGEANFVAWLTCLRGDAMAQYSGWLSAYGVARAALPAAMRASLPRLDPGPRADLQNIQARVRRSSSPAVRRVARSAYDSYLKANRVTEGVLSYDAVLRLMLGTSLGREW